MRKVILIILLFITNSLISQQIKEVKFQSNAGEYALYLEGSSSPIIPPIFKTAS
jgi:hypothetical protein